MVLSSSWPTRSSSAPTTSTTTCPSTHGSAPASICSSRPFPSFFAAVTTYPYQVVRARLQETECRYNGVLDCIRKTFKYEGIIGFYKGMCPYLVHVMPNICLVFLIYEKVTSYR